MQHCFVRTNHVARWDVLHPQTVEESDMQVAEKDVEGREVARRYVLDPKDKELVACRRCRHVAAPSSPTHPTNNSCKKQKKNLKYRSGQLEIFQHNF